MERKEMCRDWQDERPTKSVRARLCMCGCTSHQLHIYIMSSCHLVLCTLSCRFILGWVSTRWSINDVYKDEMKKKTSKPQEAAQQQKCDFFSCDEHLVYGIDLKRPNKKSRCRSFFSSSWALGFFAPLSACANEYVCNFFTKNWRFVYVNVSLRLFDVADTHNRVAVVMTTAATAAAAAAGVCAATAVERSSTSWHAFISLNRIRKKQSERERERASTSMCCALCLHPFWHVVGS